MSVEEEVELRELVAQTLELNGCLPKIRAQLRANLFLALDEDSKISKQQPLINNKIKSHLEVPEGQLMFCLVREFLEYFELDFTISVYEPESYLGNYYKYEGRQKIIEDLGLNTQADNISGPILLQLIKFAQKKSNTLEINLNINGKKNDALKDSTDSIGDSTTQEVTNGLPSNLSDVEKKSEKHQNAKQIDVDIKKNKKKNILDCTYIKNKEIENDDTFNGTSSIEEESLNGTANDQTSQKSSEDDNSSLEQNSSSDTTKSKTDDKLKISQKSEKLKPKLDLSPLQLNKSRGSDILPSLYTKDFKEKSNKELDLDFDIKDDYEEDFMSGSEVEFSLSKVDSAKHLMEESIMQSQSSHSHNIPSISFRNKTISNSNNSNSDIKSISNVESKSRSSNI